MIPAAAWVVTFEMTLEDYRTLQRHLCRPLTRPPMRQHVLVALASGAIMLMAIAFLPSAASFFVGFF